MPFKIIFIMLLVAFALHLRGILPVLKRRQVYYRSHRRPSRRPRYPVR